MQSQQEELVRELSEHSMGASFVFEPLDYSKGNSRREHADLAWANNSTVVLMAMKAGRQSAATKRLSSLKQLRGGLRAWRDLGIPIRGLAKDCEVELAYDPTASLLLLTVEDGDDAQLLVHSCSLQRGTPIIEASIPEPVLAELARKGGSSRDLVDLVLNARALPPLSLDASKDRLSKQHGAAWFRSKLNLIPGFYTDGAYRYLTDIFLALRRLLAPSSARTTCHGLSNDFVGALDDLGWPGLFAFLSSMWSPDDPGPSTLWRPRYPSAEEHYESMKMTCAFMKTLPGIDWVTVSTIVKAPPASLTQWPRLRTHKIETLQLGRHKWLVARIEGTMSGSWQADWANAWSRLVDQADPDYPPQGVIAWESVMGFAPLFVGQTGTRASDTAARILEAVT